MAIRNFWVERVPNGSHWWIDGRYAGEYVATSTSAWICRLQIAIYDYIESYQRQTQKGS